MPKAVVRVGEQARIDVAVRADQRQVGHRLVQLLGQRLPALAGSVPVGGQG